MSHRNSDTAQFRGLSVAVLMSALEKLENGVVFSTPDPALLPQELRTLLRFITQVGAVSCETLAPHLESTEQEAAAVLVQLSERGLLEHVPTCGIPVYRVCGVPFSLPAR